MRPRPTVALFALALSGCAALAVATKGRSYPDTSGTLTLAGPSAPITIHRDDLGVPHIRAETEDDLWFAVGFVHAQDRLFQMDLVRRLGSGRVAAWLGDREPGAIEFDAFMRGLRLDRNWAQRLETADPRLVSAGEAYTAGVNAGADALPALPVEYRILGVDWEPWTVRDAMSAAVLNSWVLSENAPTELISWLLRDRLDTATVDALWRWDMDQPAADPYWTELRHAETGSLSAPFRGLVEFLWGVDTQGLQREQALLGGLEGPPSASNNWAVAGSRSADGAPILANDPHLLQLVPSVWYVVEGRGGDVHVAGATLAGTPFPSTGHNEHVAWGLTNVMADYVDLAVFERVGDRGYRRGAQTLQLEAVQVEVAVKGGDPVQRTVYWTDVGPVITELEGTHLVALQWNLFHARDETAQMYWEIQRAETVVDVVAAAGRPSILSQNLVSADDSGGIAWQVFGALPARTAHTGRLPYPASDPAYGWDGWLDALPGEVDPERGWLATANSKPDAAGADQISTAYLPSWRTDRIGTLLAASETHTPQDMTAIQQDLRDDHAMTRIAGLLGGVDLTGVDCADTLLDWDGQSTADASAPTLWARFQRELLVAALEPTLGEDGLALYLVAAVSGRTVIDGQLDHFVDDRPGAVRAALQRACDAPAQAWGDAHPLHILHPFGQESPALADWNMPAAPFPGSHQTVAQAGHGWGDDLHTTWMPSLRLVTPLGDVGAATFSYPGGQSGMPGHDHYSDLFDPFVSGSALPLWFDDADVERQATDTLVLWPG